MNDNFNPGRRTTEVYKSDGRLPGHSCQKASKVILETPSLLTAPSSFTPFIPLGHMFDNGKA